MKYISCRSKSEEDDFSPRDNVPAEKKLSGSKKGPEVEQIIESVQQEFDTSLFATKVGRKGKTCMYALLFICVFL